MRSRVALAVAAAVSLLLALTTSPAAAATVTAPVVAPGTNTLNGVACSTATTCVAVGFGPSGNVVVPITNGIPGTPLPAPGRFVGGVGCLPNTTTCLVVGQRNVPRPGMRPLTMGIVTPYSNGALGTSQDVPGTNSINDVACPTATICYALGTVPMSGQGVVVTLNPDGTPAATNPFVFGPYSLENLACPTPTTCFGVGSGDPLGTGDLQGVVVIITNGVPGPPQYIAGTMSVFSVACPSAATCYAVATSIPDENFQSTSILLPIIDGVVQSPLPVTGVSIGPIACANDSTCVATGLTDDGSAVVVPIVFGTPGTPQLVPGSNGFQAVACSSTTSCVAVGSNTLNQGVVATITVGECADRTPTIVGTAGNDRIFGTAGPDVIVGRGGNDSIYGYGGDDIICGGDGNDVIDGGAGNDLIGGGNGNDRIIGNTGNDELHGQDGSDYVFGSDGNDSIDGGANVDYCYGGTGTNTFANCEVFPAGMG